MSSRSPQKLTPAPERRVAAFFDLDNTLIKGSSLYYFIRGICDEGILQHRQLFRFGYENYRFKRSKTENQQVMNHAATKILAFVKGRSQVQLQSLCNRLIDFVIAQKAIPQMLDRVEEHKAIGHDTWVISSAPQEIATAFAAKLDMTGAFGTAGEISDGRYTGELASPALHGERKVGVIKEISASRNYDLERSFAYSDSISDLPMLVSVGSPAIVNANKSLETIAKKNRWLIIK